MPSFEIDCGSDAQYLVDFETPGLVIVLDTIQVLTQMVPPTALGLYADTLIAGHDKNYQVVALQADHTTAFNLTGIPINFYAKINPSDTTTIWFKTALLNPLDVIAPTPTNGIIQVFIRAIDYASLIVGTTIFLYVDVVNSTGGLVNIAKWVITITN